MVYLKKMFQYHVPSKLYVQNGTLLTKVPKYVEVPAVPLDNPPFKDVKLYPMEAQDGKKPDYKQRVAMGKAYLESQHRHEEKYRRVLEIRRQWNEEKDSGMTKLDLEKSMEFQELL